MGGFSKIINKCVFRKSIAALVATTMVVSSSEVSFAAQNDMNIENNPTKNGTIFENVTIENDNYNHAQKYASVHEIECNGVGYVEGVDKTGTGFIDIDESKLYDIEADYSENLQIQYKETNNYGQSGEDTIPSYYNAVDEGLVTSVKNQGSYGTCWAFATIACSESNLIKQDMMTTMDDLSELHLAYFSYHPQVDPLGGTAGDGVYYSNTSSTGYLKIGGNFYIAMTTLANWMGVTDESVAKYGSATVVDSAYAYNKDEAHLENAMMIPMSRADEVKAAIIEYGAAGINYYSYNSFYGNNKCNYYYPNDEADGMYLGEGHAVTIVGWDDNYEKENFAFTPSGDGAWLIKNSWGEATNDNGYFWLSYYDKSLDSQATFFQYGAADNYDNQYQYDGTVSKTLLYYTDDTNEYKTTAANVFVTTGAQALEAISFYTYTGNQNYSIQIYKGLSATGNPVEGEAAFAKEISGVEPYSGYHTIKLNDDLILGANERFSVVITLSGDKNTAKFPFEHTKYASANRYESYVYEEGVDTWYDVKDYTGLTTSNCRIKAFTSNIEADDERLESKTVTDVIITKQPQRIYYDFGYDESFESEGLEAIIKYADGTSVCATDGFSKAKVDCGSTGETVVNVGWKDCVIPVEVVVDAGMTLTVNKQPYIVATGTSVNDGKNFDITVKFRSGNERRVTWDKNKCTIKGYSASVAGKQIVNVCYGDAANKVCSRNIYIYSATITAPKLASTAYNKITISWSGSYKFARYDVYRKNAVTKEIKLVASSITTTKYVDNCHLTDEYYYYVTPAKDMCSSGRICTLKSGWSVKMSPKLGKVSIISATAKEYNSNKITWRKLEGASGYIIYRRQAGQAYRIVGYVTSGSTCSFVDKWATLGTTYTYKVAGYAKVGELKLKSALSDCKSVKTKMSTPKLTGVLVSGNKARLSWSKVSGATGYEIYYATSSTGKYKKMTTIYDGGLTYSTKSLTFGKSYYYKVRAIRQVNKSNIYSSYSSYVKITNGR